MGVYSSAYVLEDDQIETIDPEDLQNDETAEDAAPESQDLEETAAAAIAQNEANYTAMMKSIGISELAVYESTGSEMIYESGNIKGFFAKIKEFFKKLWDKIKGLFKKFFALIGSYTMKDKDFVNKYKKDLVNVNLKDFTVNGYNYTNLTSWSPSSAANKIDGEIKKATSVDGFKVTKDNASKINTSCESVDKADIVEAMRGASIGKGKLDDSEFTEELFAYFRDGENSPVELGDISITACLSNIQNTSAIEKNAKKAFTETEKAIKEILKDLDKTEKEAYKAIPDKDKTKTEESSAIVKATSNVNGYVTTKMNILTKVNGALLRALKDGNRQCKAICVKALTYKPKNEGFTHYTNEGGFLGNVNFI